VLSYNFENVISVDPPLLSNNKTISVITIEKSTFDFNQISDSILPE